MRCGLEDCHVICLQFMTLYFTHTGGEEIDDVLSEKI